ncbi:hypothetical protein FPOAC2_04290 [Fusarium poae]|uniref:C2H2-type domain-containing protein n=1 Tax=Fusarium poae TaxID=36050 RepID=A0A1B8ARW6_FUSPO|nr:hypothetical protein FPOA_03806 [Fusarium poae]
MGLTPQEQISAQELHRWHETMRSTNGTEYMTTTSSHQSHQSRGHHVSNASGPPLHHQRNINNGMSDDLSARFLDNFYMVYDHPTNGMPFMRGQQDSLALVSTMNEWQDSLTFDPTVTAWQDHMAYNSTTGDWQDLPAFDPTMGTWQDSSTDTFRSSSVSANSGPSTRDDGTQESFICNDECCQGRAFSSRANLRRHQNERKGLRRVYACSFCHRVFSRSTACRLHQQNGVCFKSNGWVGATQ